MISPVKGIPSNTDLDASSSKDLPSDSDSESDDYEDDSAVKNADLKSAREYNGIMLFILSRETKPRGMNMK
jgi:hypothetical protein